MATTPIGRVQVDRVDLTQLEIPGLALGRSESDKANDQATSFRNKYAASALVGSLDLRDPAHGAPVEAEVKRVEKRIRE
jgi:hypothetical protein